MLNNHPKNNFFGYLGIVIFTLVAGLTLKTFVLDAFCVPSASMASTLLPGDYVFVNKLVYGAKIPNRLPFSQAAFPFFRLIPLKKIKPGDVIFFELPDKANLLSSSEPTYFVKRCVAVAGDTLAIHDGVIYLNGNVLDIPSNSTSQPEDIGPIVVPKKDETVSLTNQNYQLWGSIINQEGHSVERSFYGILIDGKYTTKYTIQKNYLYVLGDNINHSYDSRSWGFLPEDNVVGKAMMIYWSSDISNTSIRWNRIGSFIK